MIELRTLGTLDLRDPGNGREFGAMLARPKRVALLAYLALAKPRGVHHRDTLLGIFWPETSQERARHALNQALYVLRCALGGGVVVTRGAEEIGINVAELWCDAAAFDAAFGAGKWEEALELYGGDLLNGFYLSDCPEFEKWRDGERALLRERASEAAWSLADEAEGAGNAVAAAQWGRRAVAFAPGDEGALRRLIVLLDRVGDRTGALREYEGFAEQVRQDYEAEPAPETQELVERVRAREQANGGVLPSAPVTKQANDAPVTRVTVEARRSWRTRRLASAALVALGAVTMAGATLIRNSRGAQALDPTRVLVDIFQNETGDPSLEHLGRMATDRVTAGLTLTGFVDVVSLGTRLLSREPVVLDTGMLERADLQALARANGTGTVVSGSYYLQRDSIHFLAHVTDAGTGEELATLEPVRASVDAAVDAVEQLRDRVMTTLATLTDPRLAKWMRYASRPPTFEAYQVFVKGIETHTVEQKWREALPYFLEAAALDSTFTMPLIWAVWSGDATDDSVLQVLDRRKEQLPPLDRHLFDYHVSLKRGDRETAFRAIRRVVEIAPGSEYLFKAGQLALGLNRPRVAIEFFKQADPESGWLRGWFQYWDFYTRAHHTLGDHEAELEVARRGRQQFPHRLRRWEARALAALGRIEELDVLMEEAQRDYLRGSGVMWEVARELGRHGHAAASAHMADRVIKWYEDKVPQPHDHDWDFFWTRNYAGALSLVGRLAESRVFLEGIIADTAPPLHKGRSESASIYLSDLAVVLARQGHRQEALRTLTRYEAQAGHSNLKRVAVAAALGERQRAMQLLREAGANPVGARWDLEPLWGDRVFEELMRPKE